MNKHFLFSKILFLAAAVTSFSYIGIAAEKKLDQQLISAQTIATFKRTTEVFRLKNRIPVIYRQIPSSDVLEMRVYFDAGLRDEAIPHRDLFTFATHMMTMGTKTYSKDQIFKLTETYAFGLKCGSSRDYSMCNLSTINDYWRDGLKLLASVVTEPTFENSDVEMIRERLVSSVRAATADPSAISSDQMIQLYYGKDHPYLITQDLQLKGYGEAARDDLVQTHKTMLNPNKMRIVIVGSLKTNDLMTGLNQAFGELSGPAETRNKIIDPAFDAKAQYHFFDRDIPTAYMTIGFNAPAEAHHDAVGFDLLRNIMNQEFWREIRSKRSLSYGTHSYYSAREIGTGVIMSTTSKPKETLETMLLVFAKLKEKELTRAELQEYKTVYATEYFLAQEEHSSIAASLFESTFYHGSTDYFYDFPTKLEVISPREIRELASRYLHHFRLAIVFGRKKFEDKWALDFLNEANKQIKSSP